MFRINISWLVENYQTIDAINSYIQRPKAYTYEKARESLNHLTSNDVLSSSFKATLKPATELYEFIGIAIEKADSNSETASVFGPIIQEADATFIKSKWSILRSVLLAELSVFPTYLILQKGPYDTEVLIHNGEALFPNKLVTLLPNTLNDARMTGKALIYEMPDACAFHVFRLLEAVVTEYIHAFSNDAPKCKAKTLGQKARYLEDNNLGPEAVFVALRDLTKIHRNPIVHLDSEISLNDAVSLIGMSHAVVAPMLDQISGFRDKKK